MRGRGGGERRKGKEMRRKERKEKERGVTMAGRRKLYKQCMEGKAEQLKQSRGGMRGSD